MGLALLLLIGGCVAALVLVWGIVRDARCPARATAGWALARGLQVDPAALGLEFSDECFCDGLRAWKIRGGDPSSDVTTVLIHGWRRSRIDSLRRIHPWFARSRELWLIDLAGHGESPRGPTTLGVRDVDDVMHLARSLVEGAHANAPRATRLLIVGHSLGASIGLRASARLEPQSLAGVVAIAPYESLAEPLTNRLVARALPAIPFARIAAGWLHALCGVEASPSKALAQLHHAEVPLLVIASTHDAVVSVEHVVQMVAQADHTRARHPLHLFVDQCASHDDLATAVDNEATTPCATAMRSFLATITDSTAKKQPGAATKIEA